MPVHFLDRYGRSIGTFLYPRGAPGRYEEQVPSDLQGLGHLSSSR